MAKIIADAREKNSMVISELVSSGVEVNMAHLKVADYFAGDVAIERKTVSDFISSIIDRRLIKQLKELKQYEKRMLIIEGIEENEFYNDDNKTGMHANAIRGMLLSSILDFNVPILFTKDSADTASFLKVLAKRMETPARDIRLKAKKKAYNLAEQQQMVIEGFPSVGPSTAKALLKQFGTIKGIVNANSAELKKVKRLGEKRAQIIKDIIEKEAY